MATITIQSPMAIAFPPLADYFTLSNLDQQPHVDNDGLDLVPQPSISRSKRPCTEIATSLQTLPPGQLTQTALLVNTNRTYDLIRNFPAPKEIGPYEVVIRSQAIGLNHIDWKSVDYNFCLPELPWITGREMAGVVERIGDSVSKLKVGDAVWTSTYYKDRRAGCFQDLVTVPQHTVFPIPKGLDFAAAACLGVGGLTAAMSLWRWLGVPLPSALIPSSEPLTPAPSSKEVVLIWGGSTVTGQFAIQIAIQAGLEVIAICSTSTAALVSDLGATHVVTYTDKTEMHIIGEILCLANGRLSKAIDLVGCETAAQVLRVIGACGRQVDFAPLAFMSRKEAVPDNAIVHTVEMKQFVLDCESEKYGAVLNELIERNVLRIPMVRGLTGGLGAVERGLEELKRGGLKGEKLVVLY